MTNSIHKFFILFFLVLNGQFFSQSTIVKKQGNEDIKTISVIDSLKQVLKRTGQDTIRVKTLNALAVELISKGNYYVAMDCLAVSKTLAENLRFKKGLADAINSSGTSWWRLGDYEKAMQNWLRALKLREEMDDRPGIAKSYSSIGIIYQDQGNYEKALENYSTALEIAKNSGDKKAMANAYNNIGDAYYRQGIFSSDTAFKRKKYYAALNNLEMSLKMAEEAGDKQAESNTLSNIGNIYFLFGNMVNEFTASPKLYRKDLDCQFKALKIKESIGDKHGITISYSSIGIVYHMLDKIDSAYFYFEKSLGISKEIGNKSGMRESYSYLGQLSEEKGDHKKALEYHKLFSAIKDSLHNENSTRQIAEMAAKYQSEKNLEEIKLLQKTNEVKQLTIFLLIAGIAFILILSVFLFQWNRSRQNKKLQAEKLVHQKEQLSAVIQTQEEERKRIAKDLHDGIGQLLAGLKLGWVNISEEITSSNPLLKDKIQKSGKVLDDAATEVRSLSHQMMPRVLNESGLAPAIEDMLAKSFWGTAIRYDFQHINVEERFSENIEVGLYRITQELISNILKHAGATEINVRLFKNAQNIVLMVEDNGKGFNFTEQKSNGLGLMNIKSRTQLINGEVSYSAGINGGTVVTIRVPLL